LPQPDAGVAGIADPGLAGREIDTPGLGELVCPAAGVLADRDGDPAAGQLGAVILALVGMAMVSFPG